MKKALIVEQGFSRGVVAAVRALAAAGWYVGVGCPGGRGSASLSKACRRRHQVPAAHEDSLAFVASVNRAVREQGYEVVFGAGEAEVLALSANRARLSAVVPHAPHDAVVAALDKDRMEAAAHSVGFSVPENLDLATTSNEREPIIVKATTHARPECPGLPPRVDTNMVIGVSAARRRVAELESLGAQARVQRFYRGRLLAYTAVVDRSGSVAADGMQIATRIWPPRAGASCRAETVPVDVTISDAAVALFAKLGWFGLAELQFLAPDDGEPRLIDLNGRFYGSLALAVAAEANLPAAWAALATGRTVQPSRARPGVTYQWLEGDLRRAWVERRGGLLRDLRSSVSYARGSVHSLASVGDPGPLFARLTQVGRAAVRGRFTSS